MKIYNLNGIIFRTCTTFLSILGRILNCSYEKISVLFNLYFQGILLGISGILPLLTKIYLLRVSCSLPDVLMCIILLGYASIYGVGLFILFKHYPPYWIWSFYQCVNDLQKLAGYIHMSYIVVNILIFICWWASLIAFNFSICYFLFLLS